jgi:hypothetical protein
MEKCKLFNNFYSTLGNNNSFQFKFPLTEDSKELQIYESYQGVLISLSVNII